MRPVLHHGSLRAELPFETWNILLFVSLKMHMCIYFHGRQSERENERAFPSWWFSPQMSTAARAGLIETVSLGFNQVSHMHSRSPGHHPIAFPSTLLGCWIGDKASDIGTQYEMLTSQQLTCYVMASVSFCGRGF